MLVALFIIAAMYWGLIFSLAEMSPALPHTGAAYSFARSAMGPWGGMFTGLAESIEYILTPAVIVFFIGSYMRRIFETPDPNANPCGGPASYMVFLLLNLLRRGAVVPRLGARHRRRRSPILAVFWVSALPSIDFDRWALNIGVGADGAKVELPEGGGSWFPFGWKGVLVTLPFAVWLFLAIEQLPLAAEESADPKKDMPKGLILGMLTLMVSALLITFLNSSVGRRRGKMHGAFSLATSGEPLLDGFRVLYGSGAAKTLAFLAVIGLIASFHTIIYAYGRQIYSLARAGYYLPFMSLTNDKKVPHMALYAGTMLGFATMMILWYVLGSEKGGAIIGAHAAQHGGVRRDDLVRDAGAVVHRAAQEHAQHRASVSQPGGRAGRGGHDRRGAGDYLLPAAGSGVPAGGVSRWPRSTCSASCTSRCMAGTSSSCRPRKSSRQQGRERSRLRGRRYAPYQENRGRVAQVTRPCFLGAMV